MMSLTLLLLQFSVGARAAMLHDIISLQRVESRTHCCLGSSQLEIVTGDCFAIVFEDLSRSLQ